MQTVYSWTLSFLKNNICMSKYYPETYTYTFLNHLKVKVSNILRLFFNRYYFFGAVLSSQQNWMESTEVRVSYLKDKTIEMIKYEQWGENWLRNHTNTYMHIHVYTQSHRRMWDYNEKSNICVLKTLGGERRKSSFKSTWRNTSWIFPKFGQSPKMCGWRILRKPQT